MSDIFRMIKEKIAGKLRGGWIRYCRWRLRNDDFTIISSNCNGGVIYSDLGIPFNSSFINLFMKAEDFVKMCSDLRGYLDYSLVFTKEPDAMIGKVNYPVAYLNDVKIFFMHYLNESEAREAWNRRCNRINWDNIYVIFTDRDGCTRDTLEKFEQLSYRKVAFTHILYKDLPSTFYIKGYEDDDSVGVLSAFCNEAYPIRRMYDQFDLVGFLNSKK